MVYIISFILFLLGLRGVLMFAYRRRRITQVEKKINLSESRTVNEAILYGSNGISETQLEKTFKKNSKLVSISSALDKNVKAKAILFSILAFPVLLFWCLGWLELKRESLLIVLIVVLAVVIILPSRVQAVTTQRRHRKIANDVPYLIDLLAVCIQSGMTVEASLSFTAYKIDMINKDLSSLLVRTTMRADVSGIDSALEQLASEVNSDEIRMLCSTLMQSTKFGSSVYSILIDLSKDIRQLQLLSMEEKVAALSAKMTFPMIAFILFPLIAIVAGPGLVLIVNSL